jgi:predicted DNA binding CopG/RHH family protein
MDENDLRPISFRTSGEELESIDRAARDRGLSRAEYIRQRLLNVSSAPSGNTTRRRQSENPIILLHEVLYAIQLTHKALYQLAQHSGSFSEQQLDDIEAESLKAGIEYLKELDERIARHRQQIGLGNLAE